MLIATEATLMAESQALRRQAENATLVAQNLMDDNTSRSEV